MQKSRRAGRYTPSYPVQELGGFFFFFILFFGFVSLFGARVFAMSRSGFNQPPTRRADDRAIKAIVVREAREARDNGVITRETRETRRVRGADAPITRAGERCDKMAPAPFLLSVRFLRICGNANHGAKKVFNKE